MWPHPFQGQLVVHRLGLAMINLHTKFKVSTFTHYRNMKGNAKCKIWGGLGVRGHSKLPPLSPFNRVTTTSYSTLIDTTCINVKKL